MSNPFWNGTDFNPIISVDGVSLPVTPSSFSWNQEDLSNASAGRSEDGVMHKNRIGMIRSAQLEWQNLPIETMQTIINMFSPEYIMVVYIDPATGLGHNYRRREVFYVGNRSVTVKNAALNICEKLSFNIITRNPSSR